MFSRFRKDANPEGPSSPANASPGDGQGRQGLAGLLNQGLVLQADRVALLKDGLTKGLEFFDKFNESRLTLAFASFDEEMKKALYEVLFLLHVNDPRLAGWKYQAVELEHIGGTVREKTHEAIAELYLEGAPYGVEGLDKLSAIFKDAFTAHIRQEFNMEIPGGSAFGFCPIVSIHSLGSIGTVGHKSRASDLDLQVQYEVEPFLIDTSQWGDQELKAAIGEEIKFFMNRFRVQQKIPPSALKDAKVQQGLRGKANQQVGKSYPALFKYLVTKSADAGADLAGPKGTVVRTQVQHEMMALIKRAGRITGGEEIRKRETLLKERINRVQDYIMNKYPQSEIYLFTSSNDDYRKGHHGTTLESKESSGSAYELILNYETLMPGIQITPMVPSHFVLPDFINNDAAMYDRMMDYIRFGLVELYGEVRPRVTNLGATPDMPLTYVAKHSGAVYWEAFKASSGNLPKALLNLLRYEMLLDKRTVKTNIQIIKHPGFLTQFVSPKPEDETADIEAMVQGHTGIPVWALLELEEKFPLLLQDPWWLRYKALKIGFHEEKGVEGPSPEERRQISKIIDLAFALHVRISDVFTKPGDTRPFDAHREQVLIQFLRRAFPPVSPKRLFLEHLFIGEVKSVNAFEAELRVIFQAAMGRVNKKIAAVQVPGESNQKEFEIWYHYYQQNFEPAPNVVQRTIMNHLKVPRGRLQIGFRINEGWFFQSMQKESSVGKRFDTFGMLDHLPENVVLREKSSFLAGLADCIVNGYYGVLNEGTLKETRTVIEFDAKSMDLGNRVDNSLAFLRPDTLHRILEQIIEFFPYQPYHYMDCIRKKREITEVFVFLNLLKFGRLSVLYRDNLRTWYCDEYEHPELFKQAQALRTRMGALVGARPLHISLAKFFKGRGVNLNRASLKTWVNPNSAETTHSGAQMALKERELAEALRQIILQVHQPKQAEEGAAAVPPGAAPPAPVPPAGGDGARPASAGAATAAPAGAPSAPAQKTPPPQAPPQPAGGGAAAGAAAQAKPAETA